MAVTVRIGAGDVYTHFEVSDTYSPDVIEDVRRHALEVFREMVDVVASHGFLAVLSEEDEDGVAEGDDDE